MSGNGRLLFLEDEDIVCSLWKHRAGYNSGYRLTTCTEHKGVLLPNFNVSNKEYDYLSDAKDITNNIRMFVADSDQSSGYPSDTLAANVSKDTTMRELLSVEGLEKEEFKLNNINLMFGKVNHIDYVSRMMKFPTLRELCKGR